MRKNNLDTKNISIVVMAWLLLSAAHASVSATVHEYTGGYYLSASGVYTYGDRVTGTYTTEDPLWPHMSVPFTSFALTWEMTDGINLFTETNSIVEGSGGYLSTDSDGNILSITFELYQIPVPAENGGKLSSLDLRTSYTESFNDLTCSLYDSALRRCFQWEMTEESWADHSKSEGGGWISYPEGQRPVVELPPGPSPGGTTYHYVGAPFSTVTPPYTNADTVVGSFTVATPFPPNARQLNLVGRLTKWEFTDGHTILNQSNSKLVDAGVSNEVFTDRNGNITGIDFALESTPLATVVGDKSNLIAVLGRAQAAMDASCLSIGVGGRCASWELTMSGQVGIAGLLGEWTHSPASPNFAAIWLILQSGVKTDEDLE